MHCVDWMWHHKKNKLLLVSVLQTVSVSTDVVSSANWHRQEVFKLFVEKLPFLSSLKDA